MKAVRARSHSGDRRRLELSTHGVVERIAEARRAVVAVIVVAIELVLRQLVPLHELLKLQTLGWREIELLRQNRPIPPLVFREHGVEIESMHPVARVARQESRQEMRLIEGEHSPVVGNVGPVCSILDPYGVVAESLPHLVAPAEGEEIDGEVCPRLVGNSGGRGGERRIDWKHLRLDRPKSDGGPQHGNYCECFHLPKMHWQVRGNEGADKKKAHQMVSLFERGNASQRL